MTVEMPLPFVWPEIPDLTPWGKKEKEKEVDDMVKLSGSSDSNEQRAAATKLRAQVEDLFKRQEHLVDQTIERKKRSGGELTKGEQEKEDKRIQREAQLKEMSALQLWEDKKTDKTVQSDDRSKFIIKA